MYFMTPTLKLAETGFGEITTSKQNIFSGDQNLLK
jgi:hypothetical protein